MEERLQKYMARCGVASRRKCEEFILQGMVEVNGNLVNELGAKVNCIEDKVSYKGELIFPEETMVYIALNKPEGIISTVSDDKGRETILDIVKVPERIYPIGRLDYDTSGLILLTNDGNIYNRLIHPSVEVNKVYEGKINGTPNGEEIDKFKNGIDIDGYITAKANFKLIRSFKDSSEVEITIHEGKNRQIRKMCEAIGHPVISLKRTKIGKIKIANIKVGEWRHLTTEEVEYLKNL